MCLPLSLCFTITCSHLHLPHSSAKHLFIPYPTAPSVHPLPNTIFHSPPSSSFIFSSFSLLLFPFTPGHQLKTPVLTPLLPPQWVADEGKHKGTSANKHKHAHRCSTRKVEQGQCQTRCLVNSGCTKSHALSLKLKPCKPVAICSY